MNSEVSLLTRAAFEFARFSVELLYLSSYLSAEFGVGELTLAPLIAKIIKGYLFAFFKWSDYSIKR